MNLMSGNACLVYQQRFSYIGLESVDALYIVMLGIYTVDSYYTSVYLAVLVNSSQISDVSETFKSTRLEKGRAQKLKSQKNMNFSPKS